MVLQAFDVICDLLGSLELEIGVLLAKVKARQFKQVPDEYVPMNNILFVWCTPTCNLPCCISHGQERPNPTAELVQLHHKLESHCNPRRKTF